MSPNVERRFWSKQQLEAVFLKDYEEDFILIYGGTGSGKSSAGIDGFLRWTRQFEGLDFGMMAKTSKQTGMVAMRNLRRSAKELGIKISQVKRDGVQMYMVGNNYFIALDGADVSAAERAQGFDLAGLYIDEVVNIHPFVIEEMVNRIRAIPDAKMVMTCNPEDEGHDFYIDYVMRAEEIGMRIIILNPKHNPGLSAKALKRIVDTSIGGMYERRVEGMWFARTGRVYPTFTPPTQAPGLDAFNSFYIAVDPGYSDSATHALLIGKLDNNVYWVLNEVRLEFMRDKFQLSSDEQADRILTRFSDLPRKISFGIVDSADQSMKRALHYKGGFPVYNSDKDNLMESIPYSSAMVALDLCRLSDKVPHLHTEMMAYSYDDKGLSKPLKTKSIHGLDALRYFLWTNRAKRNPIHVDKLW